MSERILPPKVDSKTLDLFFDDVAAKIGAENISRDPSTGAPPGPQGQENYGDAFPLGQDHTPSGAVRPSTVVEVQHVLKVANRYNVPLWTVSRGKNLGYGGASPVVRGSIVLDLQRMKKIIEINEEYAYAIVEPGVTFFDLYEAINQRGLQLWPSCPSLGWGSVLGNTLERGFGYTPEGEHSQTQCGMEVVLPNGELVRTGMGAMEGSTLFPLFKGGFGPSIDGLFFQSNLGVVTQIGVHITPAPEAYIKCEISVPKEEDLVPLTGILSDLLRRRIIANSPGFANIVAQVLANSRDPDIAAKITPYLGKCSIPTEILDDIRAHKDWPYWTALISLYGTLEVVQAQLQSVKRAFEKVPGVKVTSQLFSGPPGESLKATVIGEAPEVLPQTGRPTLASLAFLNVREPGGGHVAFAPIIPPSGRELYEWYLEAKQTTTEAGFNFLADFHLFARYVIAINLVMFTGSEQKEMNTLLRRLTDQTTKRGFSEYRTHVSFMDNVASHHSFNNSAQRKLMTSLKDMLDPKGILSPGKSGIWNSKASNKL